MCNQIAAPNIFPWGICCCSKQWCWCANIFIGRKPANMQPQRLLGALYFPISGQTLTHPSNLDSRITFPVKFVLKSSDRIKTVSSVVSETLEENSVIKFWRFGCNFLFAYLLNNKTGYKDRGKQPSRYNRGKNPALVHQLEDLKWCKLLNFSRPQMPDF